MGVPAFFRWLSRKYPSVIIECVENRTDDGNGGWLPEDGTLPNPNGIEFDNLYLDMNGIIHPCTHPEDKPAPKNEDEMMVAIFECIDRLMNIVRPRKVLYMAIDGVAPRAKMNQQRSRRFRASKETVEKQAEVARIREKLIRAGAAVPPEKPKGDHFDSNCITPGTPFMERLSRCLHYYVHDRLNNHSAWKNLKVFLSDANVPGEGEHKIMDYIRRQRAQPDHDPNTQHVLCGADADLIMLGLATHEPNFTIIREEFLPNKPRPCDICGQTGHEMNACEGLNANSNAPDIGFTGSEVKYIFVRLPVLKEYLMKTLAMPNLPFPYDFERAVDDWVFMCFFVGNDFLPHLPSLEIREGAIDRLIELYKKCVYRTGGYLTDSGDVNLDRVQMILSDLGLVEDEIFRQRQKREIFFRNKDKANKRPRLDNNARPNFQDLHNSKFAPTPLGQKPTPISDVRREIANFRTNNQPTGLQAMLRPENSDSNNRKRKSDQMENEKESQGVAGEEEEEEDPDANDEVRLWEVGFKDRYYESKFDVSSDNLQFRYSVGLQYVRGLSWVLQYYYQGCASWDWYFPYHYAPFASDFVSISGLSTKFDKGTKPFNPLEQLMSVFPAASSSHVPEPWANLMSDPDSCIIDFYPEDFKIDLNGKKFAWQGVALLPFVDERRLIKALKPYYELLTEAEVRRNKRGDDRLYVGPGNSGYSFLYGLYKNKVDTNTAVAMAIEGVQGTVLLSEDCVNKGKVLDSPILGQHDVEDNRVVTVRFRDPTYSEDFVFKAKRLAGAKNPPSVLAPENKPSDYKPMIGFTRNIPHASLGDGGHRMINHYAPNHGSNESQRNFASIPPPAQLRGNQDNRSGGYRNDYGSRHQGGSSGGGNSGNYNQYQQNRNHQQNFNNNRNMSGGSVARPWMQNNQTNNHNRNSSSNWQDNRRNNNNNYNNNNNNNNNNRGAGGGGGGYNRW